MEASNTSISLSLAFGVAHSLDHGLSVAEENLARVHQRLGFLALRTFDQHFLSVATAAERRSQLELTATLDNELLLRFSMHLLGVACDEKDEWSKQMLVNLVNSLKTSVLEDSTKHGLK